jgi:hypothetical protein
MKKAILIIVAVVFVLGLCPGAYATQTSFRCGNLFVAEGTKSIAVLASCGEPLVKEDLGYRGRGGGRKLEQWVYGPSSGYYTVINIEGGVVTKVEAVRAD